jgi:carbon storage regulator CsrA
MLVLTRKQGQKVMIGHQVTLTVLDIRGDAVKFGIEAPREIAVHRHEVYEEILRANQHAHPAHLAGLPKLPHLSQLPNATQNAKTTVNIKPPLK